MRLVLAQRHHGPLTSIEEIFSTVSGAFPPGLDCTVVSAPRGFATVASLLANILWFRSLRGYDLAHQTGDTHYAILGTWGRPVVLTVHDLRFYEEARGFKRWVFWWLWLYLPCMRTNRVTTVSEFTKQRLLAAVSLPERKVTVVPNCVSPRFVPREESWRAEEPLILHVGTTPNKNLGRLALACSGLKIRLCVLGRLSGDQRRSLQQSGIPFEERFDLPQEEVVKLYQHCDLVSFVSTYEGFGMPILEGQAVGRPVLTSNLSPMREVAGGGALLVDPFDAASIRTGLLRLLNEPQLREQLVSAGFQNVSQYSPKAVAEQYLAVYREVLARQ